MTSYGHACTFADYACVPVNSPDLFRKIPSMLLKSDGPLSLDFLYVIKNLSWARKFFQNCTTNKVKHISNSLANLLNSASTSYDEIFSDVDVSKYIKNEETLYLYQNENDFLKAKISNTSRNLYKSLLMSIFDDIDDHFPLKGFKIVVDASNGAAYKIAPQILLDLGADVIPIACSPNGKNINLDCGSTHPETLRKTVVATEANLGIALDGDADRILMVDENGRILDGDQILYILAKSNISNASFNNKVVGTITTNSGLETKLKEMNIDLYRSDVGDKNVYSMMKKIGAIIGGESSGHIINSEYSPTGDALLTALIVIKESIKKNSKISDLVDDLELLPVLNDTFDTENMSEINENQLKEIEDRINSENKDGRVIIRSSGTEPLIRISIENKDQKTAKKILETIRKNIKESG